MNKCGKGDGWVPEDSELWPGTLQGPRQGKEVLETGPVRARVGHGDPSYAVTTRSQDWAERAKSRTRCRVALGRNPNDTHHPGQRSQPPLSLRVKGPRRRLSTGGSAAPHLPHAP